MKICFLASGGGGNLKFLHLSKEYGILKNIELLVIADRECSSIEFAKSKGIYSSVITYKRDNNQALKSELKRIDPDIIITNWHKIIDNEVVDKYAGKLINLHYSLLPAFAGLIGVEPIEKAYIQGCKYIGATCHYVDNGVDTGKIISQTVVKTEQKIENAIQEVFQNGCIILLSSIIRVTKNNSLISIIKNNNFDFSPSLQFDHEVFDNNFWKQLKQL